MSIIQGRSNQLRQLRKLVNRPSQMMLGVVESVDTTIPVAGVNIRGTVCAVGTGGLSLAIGDSVMVASGMVQRKLSGTLGSATNNIITFTGG